MGKKSKEHRKKVMARNERIKATQSRIQKVWQEEFERAMEEAKKKVANKEEDNNILNISNQG
jgi:DNA primase large subunit